MATAQARQNLTGRRLNGGLRSRKSRFHRRGMATARGVSDGGSDRTCRPASLVDQSIGSHQKCRDIGWEKAERWQERGISAAPQQPGSIAQGREQRGLPLRQVRAATLQRGKRIPVPSSRPGGGSFPKGTRAQRPASPGASSEARRGCLAAGSERASPGRTEARHSWSSRAK
jgi:hypothetical protein